MKVLEGVTRFVAAAYEPEVDERRWLEGVHEAASSAFEGQIAVQAMSLDVRGGAAKFLNVVGEEFHNELMFRLHEVASADDVASFYLSGPFVRLSARMASSPNEQLRRVAAQNMRSAASVDVVAANGVDASGLGCCLAFVRREGRMSLETRSVLSRMAGHLSAAYRLRRFPFA